MSDFSDMCDIVKKYCTVKRYTEKIFKYKKYPVSKEQGNEYCVYLYKRFAKFIDRYHKELYNKLNSSMKSTLRDEVFFPLALEAFNKAYDMLEDRFNRWYEKHPNLKYRKKHNG